MAQKVAKLIPSLRKIESKRGDVRRKVWRFRLQHRYPSEFYTRRRDAVRGAFRAGADRVDYLGAGGKKKSLYSPLAR